MSKTKNMSIRDKVRDVQINTARIYRISLI